MSQTVRVMVGRAIGEIGVITGVASGWVAVSLADDVVVSRRAAELEVVSPSERGKSSGNTNDASRWVSTSIDKFAEENDNDEGDYDNEDEETEGGEEEEYHQGSRVVVIATDKVSNRVDLLGKEGTIVETPREYYLALNFT